MKKSAHIVCLKKLRVASHKKGIPISKIFTAVDSQLLFDEKRLSLKFVYFRDPQFNNDVCFIIFSSG